MKRTTLVPGRGVRGSRHWRSPDWEGSRKRGVWLCHRELRKFFDFPPEAAELELVASKRERPESYRVTPTADDEPYVTVETRKGPVRVHVDPSFKRWLPRAGAWVRVLA